MGRWRYAVWVLVVAYMAWGLVAGVFVAVNSHGWTVAALYTLGLACCVIAFRRRSLNAGNLMWLAVASAMGLATHAFVEFSGTTLLFLAVWMAPFRTRLWHAMALTVCVAVSYTAISIATSVQQGAIIGIALGLGWAGFLAAILNQLAVTRQRTSAVALAQARAAVLGERQRLAREIHDILAHSLSAQVMHLEGARLLLEQDGDRGVVLDRVTRAGDLARSGLEETKRAVEALRGDQTPLADQLERLAGQFRTATGRPCSLTVSGDPQLVPEAWLAVVRTAQEALTNVHKHAPEAQVMMDLRCDESWCELEVRDTGGTAGDNSTGNGYGLVGMRERAELIGGTLEAGPADDGFLVRLRVPA